MSSKALHISLRDWKVSKSSRLYTPIKTSHMVFWITFELINRVIAWVNGFQTANLFLICSIVTLKLNKLFGKITSCFVPAIQFLPGSFKSVVVPYLREIVFCCITALKHTGLFSGTESSWHRVTQIHTVILSYPPKQPFGSGFWPILTPELGLYWRCSRTSSRYCAKRLF